MGTDVTWRAGLAPLAGLYQSIVSARRTLYDHHLLPESPTPCFTISIGGLEAGGSGKTPVTGVVLRRLLALGRKPGLLTRGYGRATSGLVIRERGEAPRAERIGDEPAMLVNQGLDVPVAAVARRSEGAAALAARGCAALVLDDGFSHRALQRHVDVVVLRGEQPFGDGHMLPWGSLREPPSSLRRAHVVWLHFRNSDPPHSPPAWLAAYAPHALCVMSRAVVEIPQGVTLGGTPVIAAAGIAHPADFERALRAQNADLAAFHAYADHHAYTPRDVHILQRSLQATGARALVVTPKDAVKLITLWNGAPLWVVGAGVEITYGENLFHEILEKNEVL